MHSKKIIWSVRIDNGKMVRLATELHSLFYCSKQVHIFAAQCLFLHNSDSNCDVVHGTVSA